MVRPHRRVWWLLALLLLLPPAAPSAVAAPSLVGTWKALAPSLSSSFCELSDITITIDLQCGNLFRGQVSFFGITNYDMVGRITDGTFISLNGAAFADEFIMGLGEYLPGTPPKIHLTYFYESLIPNRQFDTFDASYSGGVQPKKANMAIMELLLDD